jgi:mannose/fructose/N-acetylgalactosamine-specific phosphotransferase system component IIC
MIKHLLVTFVLGGFVGLDTTAAWQVLFSHPLISCTVVGLLYGQLEWGLFFGILFELVWFYDLPIGGARFPEGNLGSFTGLMVVLTVLPQAVTFHAWLFLMGALYAVIASYLFGLTVVFMRRNNLYLVERADRYAQQGEASKVGTMHVLGVVHTYFHGAVWATIFYVLGVWLFRRLLPFMQRLPDFPVHYLQAVLLGVGMAVMINYFINRRRLGYLAAGLLLGLGTAIFGN